MLNNFVYILEVFNQLARRGEAERVQTVARVPRGNFHRRYQPHESILQRKANYPPKAPRQRDTGAAQKAYYQAAGFEINSGLSGLRLRNA